MILSCGTVLSCLLMVSVTGAQTPPMELFDLGYTLKIDTNNREKMIHIGGFVPWAHKYTTHGTSGGHHDPVPTEWEYGKIISACNGFMDADAVGYGAMANASFFTHYLLRPSYGQDWVTRENLVKRGYLDEKGRVKFDGREFLIFYVGFLPGSFRVDDYAIQATHQSFQPERLSLLHHALHLALERIIAIAKAAAVPSLGGTSRVVRLQKGTHAFGADTRGHRSSDIILSS